MRIVIYTAIFGEYDELPSVDECSDFTYICYTDNGDINPRGWKLIVVTPIEGLSSAANNRYYKWNPHICFPEYEWSIYIDANKVFVDLTREKLSSWLGDSEMLLVKHENRATLDSELKAVFVNKNFTLKQCRKYRKDFFYELSQSSIEIYNCSVLIRRHRSKRIESLMDDHWRIFINSPIQRDQLTFPIALFRSSACDDNVSKIPSLINAQEVLVRSHLTVTYETTTRKIIRHLLMKIRSIIINFV